MSIATQLVAAGMRPEAAERKSQVFESADDAHTSMQPESAEVRRFWVPGRIEVLGKHTDYAGGRSLLCTVERGFCVTASRRGDDLIRVRDAVTRAQVEVSASHTDAPTPGHWSNYVQTVVRRLARDFPPLTGADIAFASDLPLAAGVSSSSALVIAMFLAIASASDLENRAVFRRVVPDQDALAGYLGAVENGLPFGDLEGHHGVGTFGGSEDHTAILRARAGGLVQYRFCPVVFENSVPLPSDHAFVIASSGIRAEKAGAALQAYNRLSLLSRAALERWNTLTERHHSSLGEAIGACGNEVIRVLRGDSAELAERAEQFLIESETIIPACARALVAGDADAFGLLVDQSMHNAVTMLHNQVPATIFLAERARALGATAASAFGAGFGGSVWALTSTSEASALCEALKAEYAARFPEHDAESEFFVTSAGTPAVMLASAAS